MEGYRKKIIYYTYRAAKKKPLYYYYLANLYYTNYSQYLKIQNTGFVYFDSENSGIFNPQKKKDYLKYEDLAIKFYKRFIDKMKPLLDQLVSGSYYGYDMGYYYQQDQELNDLNNFYKSLSKHFMADHH